MYCTVAHRCQSISADTTRNTIALLASLTSEQAKFISELRLSFAKHTSQPVIDLNKNKRKTMMLPMRTRSSSALAPMRCIALATLLILLLVACPTSATDAEAEGQVCTADNADSAECAGDLPPMKGVASDEKNDDGCTDDHVKCAEWADLGECGELILWWKN